MQGPLIMNCYDEYIRRHIEDKNHPDHINNERKQQHRPNKHDSTRFTNTISNNLSHPNKRPRPSTDTLDNSTVAGPSTNSEKFLFICNFYTLGVKYPYQVV
ncbi:hypothetical protein GLOIN_2v1829023 [Rhizophagus irregularis DAOM 181602=DAOM 197198]|nr:hypothetical protein GLOIN_2v1829023 [Rhizophagus irregularis DAOM 181602=DAOM 197198]